MYKQHTSAAHKKAAHVPISYKQVQNGTESTSKTQFVRAECNIMNKNFFLLSELKKNSKYLI